MSTAIQFRGREQVVEAFEARQLNAWALFSGRQFLIPHVADGPQEAALMLDEVLQKFDQATNPTYTLKVYEDLKPGDKITEKTPAHGSFNFKIKTFEESGESGGSWYNALKSENEALKAQLAAVEDEDEPEEKDVIGRILDSVIEDPGKINQFIGAIKNLSLMFTNQQPAGQLAGTPSETDLQKAITRLQAHDPELAKHLTKLADIADQDPKNFKMLLSMLESF